MSKDDKEKYENLKNDDNVKSSNPQIGDIFALIKETRSSLTSFSNVL